MARQSIGLTYTRYLRAELVCGGLSLFQAHRRVEFARRPCITPKYFSETVQQDNNWSIFAFNASLE